jgi:hsp70-interacting protein
MDKNLNELLKWSIENSDPDAAEQQPSGRSLNEETLAALLKGGPSDAELMQAALANITSTDPEITTESKLIAFDNLEQLVESLDNANLLSKLGLWTPLIELLGHDDPQFRLMAAWCLGTAVQNNEQSQERLVALGGVEKLTAMALGERVAMEKRSGDGDVMDENGNAHEKETKEVRRKAVYALSSACRNYQPGMDVLSSELGKREGKTNGGQRVEATDMDAVDTVINGLRESAMNA